MRIKNVKRILAIALASAMVFSGVTVYADEGDAPTEVTVSTGAELDAALKAATSGNTVITLANDIDAVSSATYASYETNTSITIDGQGHSISGNSVQDTGLRFGGRGTNLFFTAINTTFIDLRNDDSHGGGAIAIWRGGLNVYGSTFIGNQANNASARGNGGAIQVENAAATIHVENSTFVNNTASAGGGAINSGAPGTIKNVTIVGNTAAANGGGINVPDGRNGAAPATVVVTNSIIADNVSGGTTANVYNAIVSNEDGISSNIIAGDTSWLANALDKNGGTTPTLALLDIADSPAIDKGDATTATATDQRGVARDATPDIGAYELEKVEEPAPSGWIQDDTGWKYQLEDGIFLTNDWKKADGLWYYLGENGYLKTGWVQDGGKWYFLDRNNGSLQTGWINDSKWYYLGEDGAMATGWLQDGNDRYFLDETNGTIVTGWIEDGEDWYFMAYDTGIMATNEWIGNYWVGPNGSWEIDKQR